MRNHHWRCESVHHNTTKEVGRVVPLNLLKEWKHKEQNTENCKYRGYFLVWPIVPRYQED